MRRIAMLLGLMVVLMVLAAGVALAVNKTCKDIPCRGTEKQDTLHERQRDNGSANGLRDKILALDGEDTLDANNGSNDRDVLEGGKKDDLLLSNDRDGRDTSKGGRGSDRCVADQGDRVTSCRRISPTSVEGQKILAELTE